MVVSVSRTCGCARTALAQPSGPRSSSRSRQPVSGAWSPWWPGGPEMAGGGGVILAGGAPTAPGCDGPFTSCARGVLEVTCVQQPDPTGSAGGAPNRAQPCGPISRCRHSKQAVRRCHIPPTLCYRRACELEHLFKFINTQKQTE